MNSYPVSDSWQSPIDMSYDWNMTTTQSPKGMVTQYNDLLQRASDFYATLDNSYDSMSASGSDRSYRTSPDRNGSVSSSGNMVAQVRKSIPDKIEVSTMPSGITCHLTMITETSGAEQIITASVSRTQRATSARARRSDRRLAAQTLTTVSLLHPTDQRSATTQKPNRAPYWRDQRLADWTTKSLRRPLAGRVRPCTLLLERPFSELTSHALLTCSEVKATITINKHEDTK